MSKAYLGAFVAIAAIAVGAVDYINQAKAAGSAPGRFGIGAYAASISDRVIGQRQVTVVVAERQELPATTPRDLLPEPPAGWPRHDRDAATADHVGRDHDMPQDASVPDEIKQDPTMKALAATDKTAATPTDPASAGGGLVGSILGAIGFGGGAPTMIADRPIMPAKAKSAVKVNAVGAGSCTRTGIGKRCKIGG